jgi:hypothetical protein
MLAAAHGTLVDLKSVRIERSRAASWPRSSFSSSVVTGSPWHKGRCYSRNLLKY